MSEKRFSKAKSLKKLGSMHDMFDQPGISADTFRHAKEDFRALGVSS